MPGRGKQGCCVFCLHTSSLEIQLLHQSEEQNLHPFCFFQDSASLSKGHSSGVWSSTPACGVLGGCTFRTSRDTAAMCRQTESPILTRHSANTFYKQQECPDQRGSGRFTEEPDLCSNLFRQPGAAFSPQARVMPSLDGLSMIPYSREPSPWKPSLDTYEVIDPDQVPAEAKI